MPPVAKSFEHTIQFHAIPGGGRLPLVTARLIQPNGKPFALPLVFDTGASVTTLRADLYPLLGLQSWDQGQQVQTQTAGGANPVVVYRYHARIELLGKVVDCPVHLAQMPVNPLYVGLLGRETLFDEFGFGFWESTGELFATTSP
jgi:hypothetical protein